MDVAVLVSIIDITRVPKNTYPVCIEHALLE